MPGSARIGNDGVVPLTIARTAFETVDAYTIVDVPDAPVSIGPVRCAKKVLERTTVDLVRHATYAAAIHGHRAGGAAAALNHDRSAGEPDTIERFGAELSSWAAESGFRAVYGLGLGLGEVGLDNLEPAPSSANTRSAVAAAGDLHGSTVVVLGPDGMDELDAALAGGGVESVRHEPEAEAALSTPCDVAFVSVKTGELDHEVLDGCAAASVVALTPLATTARGLAVASRAGTTIVPDFVSAGGQYLAALGVDDIAGATRAAVDRMAGAGVDPFLRACEMAEAHLRSWAPDVPFGRPLAP